MGKKLASAGSGAAEENKVVRTRAKATGGIENSMRRDYWY
jgi:hypothetical protein